MKRFLLMVLIGAAAACGGSSGPFPGDSFALVVNRDLAVGSERILVAVSGPDGSRLASPDIGVEMRVYPNATLGDAITIAADFVWAVPEVSGMYRAVVPLDRAGIWSVEVLPEGGDPLPAASMLVSEDALTPVVGEAAPTSDTVTAADAPLAEITTDPNPDPRFYELSIADAVGSGKWSVIAFATPRFCTSAVCGPMMETLRGIAPRYPDVNWVHVEVYTNLDDPENLETVAAVVEWGLPTEPWVFVVDPQGIVRGRFEGVVSEPEIAALIG